MDMPKDSRILAEIMIPFLDRVYDFWLDENTAFGELAEEILEDVCLMESWLFSKKTGSIPVLCSLSDKMILSGSQTPKQLGMESGITLLLIL